MKIFEIVLLKHSFVPMCIIRASKPNTFVATILKSLGVRSQPRTVSKSTTSRFLKWKQNHFKKAGVTNETKGEEKLEIKKKKVMKARKQKK